MSSSYPSGIDSFATNKSNATPEVDDHPAHHNDLADAINKIEAELGANPSGSAATVKARFDALVAGSNPFVNVADYGAVGDGVADDTSEVQAAIAAALSLGVRGAVYFPPGDYRLTSTITVQGAGIYLLGRQGELSTTLIGDHSTGPVVRVMDRRNGLVNIQIDASASRISGAVGSNYGLHIEATDTAGSRPNYGTYDNVYVQNQPSHGVVCVGGIWESRFEHMTIRDNAGHGLVFDYGSLTSRTNTEPPGISTVANCEIFDNGGTGIMVGNDDNVSNRGIRLQFENVDVYRNATVAGKRKSADQVWAFCDNSTWANCAFDGHDQASTAATTRGILLYGKNNSLLNTRFLNVTPNAARLGGTLNGLTSQGNVIDGFWVQGSHQGALDPAVTVDTDVVSARVWTQTTDSITRLVTTSASQRDCLQRRTRMAVKAAAESRTSTTALASDADLFVPVNTNEYNSFRASIFYDGAAAGDIQLAFIAPAGSTLRWGPANGTRVDENDAIVVQATVTSGAINFGAGGTGTVRSIEIAGQLLTAGTAGNLQLQFAQVTSSATATRIFGQSYLEVIR